MVYEDQMKQRNLPGRLEHFYFLGNFEKFHFFFVGCENHIPRFQNHSIASSDDRKNIIIDFGFCLLFETLMFSDFLEK